MSDLAINPLSVPVGRTPVPPAAQPQAPAAQPQTPAQKTPKTDLIDLSKPPTAEQAERLRSFGFLGYGSISASKNAGSPVGIDVIHITTDYKSTYIDLVNHTITNASFTSTGVFFAGGSAFECTTTQLVQSWDNSSWKASVLYECGFTQKLGGLHEWYIPSHQNEDGSWSLAQFGPRPTSYISGYHSVLATAQHSDGQTELSLSETTVYKSVSIVPSQERPAGAVDYRNERLDLMISQELLKRIGQDIKPLPLHRFDAQA